MYKIVFSIIFAFTFASAGNNKLCCQKTATEEFATFGKDLAFVSLHEAPNEFEFKEEMGDIKMIPAADKKEARIFEVKAPMPTKKYLFVFHEWWGLNDYIKQESENFQKKLGVNVIAIDLYDNKVAKDPQAAAQYVQQVNENRARTIIQAVINYVGKDAEVATLGWCFGGGWSLQSALLLGKQAVGCVIYYGMPEKNIEKLKTLHCDVLGIFGTLDSHINPEVVSEFQKNMKLANKNLEVHNYNAVHAFANPSNPKHDKDMTEDAFSKTVIFLRAKLGL